MAKTGCHMQTGLKLASGISKLLLLLILLLLVLLVLMLLLLGCIIAECGRVKVHRKQKGAKQKIPLVTL